MYTRVQTENKFKNAELDTMINKWHKLQDILKNMVQKYNKKETYNHTDFETMVSEGSLWIFQLERIEMNSKQVFEKKIRKL